MRKYHFAVFVGRFQPPHNGHIEVCEQALANADHLIILIGSADGSRNTKNPFTFEERADMMVWALPDYHGRVSFLPLPDRPYNEQAWIAQVQELVADEILRVGNRTTPSVNLHGTSDFRVALAGYKKDGSSYYLKLFPEWDFLDCNVGNKVINSTDIRSALFTHNPMLPRDTCPKNVVQRLADFTKTEEFGRLVGEADYIREYKKAWEGSPYPPVFVTVDCVVVQSGHILLIERGGEPGKGLLALPGGFIDQHERLIDAAVRELREETEISDWKIGMAASDPTVDRYYWDTIPAGKLKSYISATKVFDYPYRSVRGRTITHSFLFKLPDSRPMYKIKGSDDAARAFWVPLGELRADEMFEDHYAIIQEMVL
jgi:bifunctional NMN adenylyltransferase/nudix hydrolase